VRHALALAYKSHRDRLQGLASFDASHDAKDVVQDA
jgi:hypothetical protein